MIKTRPSKYVALVVATGLLAVNFWAWSLLSPLATTYAEKFTLSPLMLSLLVVTPVMVGSLGRIPLGLLTDRYGGRKMFVIVCWLAALAVVGLSFSTNPNELFLAAFALGIGGASFAVGAPFVNAWFPKNQRGFALGIYALGNAGAAISGLLTLPLVGLIERSNFFWLVATLLIIAGIAMLVFGRDSPTWRPARSGGFGRFKKALQWPLTWKLSVLYGLTFGAFVALGLYLPILLNQSYGLSLTDAAARAAGFILLATVVRPVGGWLSDRFGGLSVLRVVFLLLAILGTVVACNPTLAPIGTVAYLSLAATLGVGNGAIFAIIGHRADSKLMGTITGFVGAAGGLGGYFPPLVMGLSLEFFGNYSVALSIFAAICLIVFVSLGKLFNGEVSKYR